MVMTNTFSDFANILHRESFHLTEWSQLFDFKDLALRARQTKAFIDLRLSGWYRASFEFLGIVQILASPTLSVADQPPGDHLKVSSFDPKVATEFRQIIGTHLPTVRGSQQVALVEFILRPTPEAGISQLSPSQETWPKSTLRSIQGRLKSIYPKLFPITHLRWILDKLQDLKGKSIFSILVPVSLKIWMFAFIVSKAAQMFGLSMLRISGGANVGFTSNSILYPINGGKIDVNFSHANNIAQVADNSNISGQESQ